MAATRTIGHRAAAEVAGERTQSAIAAAASSAPDAPGVYYFLGSRDQLLYVGKAGSLRRRLQQHARGGRVAGYRLRRGAQHVHDVCWETLPTEVAAAAREADLIVALQPRYNASIRYEGRWAYLVVDPFDSGRTRFALVDEPADAGVGGHVYGCFPHLGKDVSSRAGIACSDGYVALLRLLWATHPAHEGRHWPTRITHSAPPEFETRVEDGLRASLHTFLSGRSKRLLGHLWARAERLEAYLQPGLMRDFAAAERFFVHGPSALRALRLRHAQPRGLLSRATIEGLLASEFHEAVAAFRAANGRVRETDA
jgi:predicted GIY-YIG superfamily endonuclease